MRVLEKNLHLRSNSTCELCKSSQNLSVYIVPPKEAINLENAILICNTCKNQINGNETLEANHWRCLAESMWNENLPVQIVSWRLLHRLKNEGWSQELLDMMYFDDDALAWAKATKDDVEDDEKIIHKDSNGNILYDGDSVVLIKDLEVKGANFTAKRGVAVHNIKLVWDNQNQIEGRVEGQQIVILTQYVKKTK